ncbi:MAG: hypothetical protein Q8P70_00605 [bacterium]|nr:hypothetical protein [bacterium]
MNITQAEVDRLNSIEGRVRGTVFQTDAAYIKGIKGEGGLSLVEQKIQEWGCAISYSSIKASDWFPVGCRALSILSAQEVFSWDEEDVRKMGYAAPAHSFVVKMLMKYFLSIQQTYKQSAQYWPAHYTIGKLETPEFNEKEQYMIIRLKDFSVHPVLCAYFKGYFLRLTEIASPYQDLRVEERSCAFQDGKDHEFFLRWEK